MKYHLDESNPSPNQFFKIECEERRTQALFLGKNPKYSFTNSLYMRKRNLKSNFELLNLKTKEASLTLEEIRVEIAREDKLSFAKICRCFCFKDVWKILFQA